MTTSNELDRDEYIRRWIAASFEVRSRYVYPLTPPTWLLLGAIVLVQPSGRFAAAMWFAWASCVVALVASIAAAIFAFCQAQSARRFYSIWRDYYTEPWSVGGRS